ncbi:MAG: FGGY family carbohydrate kinase, partial [Acidimicrobiales bacterium]
MSVVVAIDAGTTGVRALAIDEQGKVASLAYRELTQYFPRPGWVEHDAAEIWRLVEETLAELARSLLGAGTTIAAIGLTNQRETAVAWDRRTGSPLHRAIVWQDRRTGARCAQLEEEGHLDFVRQATGLVLDSYFSATKWEWMLTEGGLQGAGRDLCLGTVDDWICWQLTGGAGTSSARHVTDASNASRTACFDLAAGAWSSDLCTLFGVPIKALGEIVPSSGRIGHVAGGVAGGQLEAVPISGIAGDQQAALFGQGCHRPGETKATYGTGSFVLMNLGPEVPPPAEGLLTTVAWQIDREITYAREGAVFASGATIQWLRDGLGVIAEASDTGGLAGSLPSSEGVYLVPAFSGLGSPWWDSSARATVTGLTRGTGRAHLARAAVEAMAYQIRDVVDAMNAHASSPVTLLRVDGGASVMDLLLQLQADQCRVPVARAATTEVTAVGAALLAGLAEGVWSREEVGGLVGEEARFEAIAS